MNKENFIKVVEFVKGIPEEHFDMSHVVHNLPDDCEPEQVKNVLVNECGSTGCVVGYMPFIFPDVFEYRLDYVGNPLEHTTVCVKDSVFGISRTFDEVDNLLGIEDSDGDFLFVDSEQQEVIDYLDVNPEFEEYIESNTPATDRTKKEQIQTMIAFYEWKSGEEYPYKEKV